MFPTINIIANHLYSRITRIGIAYILNVKI